MHKTILISQFPLPYSKIGSWTTMYNNYLKNFNLVDIIICPKPSYQFSNIEYKYFRENKSIFDKVSQKLTLKKKWSGIFVALLKAINSHDRVVLQIVDNQGLCISIIKFLKDRGIRDNFYIQFFYHGFAILVNEEIYSTVDEMILLTYKSYQNVKNHVNTFPCKFSVLHNSIDTSNFYPLEQEDKEELKNIFQVQNKTIFIWCSQDRPKKGLHIILNAWKEVFSKHKNIELWVIGAERDFSSEGIKFMGKIPNIQLPKFYQVADVYLFPTLWQEGFGLSLIEAKHSGCYCIASALGGVPEVLEFGKYGKLIENPNFVEDWVVAIEDYLEGNYKNIPFPKDLYSMENWNKQMNIIITNAKESFK